MGNKNNQIKVNLINKYNPRDSITREFPKNLKVKEIMTSLRRDFNLSRKSLTLVSNEKKIN